MLLLLLLFLLLAPMAAVDGMEVMGCWREKALTVKFFERTSIIHNNIAMVEAMVVGRRDEKVPLCE